MAFVPTLPKFISDIFPFVFNGTGRTAGAAFKGALYPPKSTSDNEGPSDEYLRYPLAVTSLHDPREYNFAGFDAIRINFNGQAIGYRVTQVLPRYCGHPNQHRLAQLTRMSDDEHAAITTIVSEHWQQPNYNLQVTPYVYDQSTNTRSAAGWFMGRFEVGEMTSNKEGRNDGFLLYPKNVSNVNDPSLYDFAGCDAITFAWGGRTLGWAVLQVLPRLAGEPAEHFQAVLRRLSANELANIATPTAGCAVGEIRHHRPVVFVNLAVRQPQPDPDIRLLIGGACGRAAGSPAIAVQHNPGAGAWRSQRVRREAARLLLGGRGC